jgi:hypothetical protein
MIDFRISATGESLDMYPDTVLNLEINNPLFDTDIIKGALIYPFDFPDTPGNRRKLGFPAQLLNTTTVSASLASDLYIEGILFKSGTLTILKQVDSKITTSFVAGVGALNTSIAKNLPDIDYGAPVPFSYNAFTVNVTAIGTGLKIGLAIDFTFGGVTTTFHKAGTIVISDNPSFDAAVQELQALFLADTSGMATNHVIGIKYDHNTLIANSRKLFFRLADNVSAVLNTGNADYNGTWNGGFLLDPIAADMKANASLSYPDVNFTFPVISAPDFYTWSGGSISSYPGLINFYATDIQQYLVNAAVDGLREGLVVVPQPFFVHIFKKVFEATGYKIKGSFLDDADVMKLIIFNNFALDSVVYDAASPTVIVINKWSDTIDLKNHVPDISITDFIKGVKNFFNLGIFVDDSKKTVEFILLRDVVRSDDYDDWTSITLQTGKEIDFNTGSGYTLKVPDNLNADVAARAIPLAGTVKASVTSTAALAALTDHADGDLRLVTDLDQYYKCTRLYDGTVYSFTWSFFSENYYSYVVGDGKNEIPLSIGTLLMDTPVEHARVPHWLVPVMSGTGSGNYFNIGINKAPFTLLNYHGMNDDSASLLYPLASNGYKDYAGSLEGSLSLKPGDASYGIYAQYYKDWITFLNKTRPVTLTCNLDLAKLMSPNMQKKKRIDNVQYIINKITVAITMQGISPATVIYNKI